jgi:hypothetical protein
MVVKALFARAIGRSYFACGACASPPVLRRVGHTAPRPMGLTA